MTWCLRNEVLVTGCGRGFGLGGGSAEFSQKQEGSQGAIGGQDRVLGPDSNVSSQASPMVSHPPQSLCQNLDVLFPR